MREVTKERRREERESMREGDNGRGRGAYLEEGRRHRRIYIYRERE